MTDTRRAAAPTYNPAPRPSHQRAAVSRDSTPPEDDEDLPPSLPTPDDETVELPPPAPISPHINFDLNEYLTLQAASLSDAFIRTIRGPAGSAKTSWAFVEVLRRACEQTPAADGVRYHRCLVGRLTYQVLASATLETARKTIGQVVRFKESIPPTGLAKFSLPDGTSVHCEFEFLSLDGDEAFQKLLGYEPTSAILDEISELPEAIIHAVARRIGRYPSGNLGRPTWTGIIGVTNGPTEGHWLHKWEMGDNRLLLAQLSKEMGGRPYFHAFAQPPGLLRPHNQGEDWRANPKAENVRNLPGGYGYYFNMLADPDEAKVKAFVEGEFAPLKSGKIVFPNFRKDRHVVQVADFQPPEGVPLGLSFDFGRTPVCHLWAETSSGRLVAIEEFMVENASVEELVREHLRPLLHRKYRTSTIDWATGDPAGEIKGQQVDTSAYEVLWDLGIPIEHPGGNNRIEPRLEAVNQRLSRLDSAGHAMLQIRSNCAFTIESFTRTYIYEQVSKVHDIVRDKPTKSHTNWTSDLNDSVQYACQSRAITFNKPQRKPLPPLKHSWG